MVYRTAGPSEVIAIIGSFITDPGIVLAKKKWIWPGQMWVKIDLTPVNYTLQVQAMNAKKLPFILLAVFTIGPRVDCNMSVLRYAMLMSTHDKRSTYVTELVQGVIKGKTLVLAASMTMEEIFHDNHSSKSSISLAFASIMPMSNNSSTSQTTSTSPTYAI